ncbi:C-type lectin domain family 10 member A-like isoform X2 [Eleginops maclovinus]|uniref:C-type lectin domain family 10 member A-like isoform X2 n=1 Tax=Eleginops maclovinus TaxID=56733 RepID=UPI0030803B48
MEEIYANVESVKPLNSRSSAKPKGPRSSERFLQAAVLCLGLLSLFLLAGLIGLAVRYHNSVGGAAADLSSVKANLTERLQASDQQLSSVSEERDRLNASLTEKTKEVARLQSSKTICPAGWRKHSCSCYLLHKQTDSWEKAREHCRERGAHLVVIDSAAEQTDVWIGLSDREKEGTWKWVDGSPLTLRNWETIQPDNGGGDPRWGEEDCAIIYTHTNEWHDRSCESTQPWICEKEAVYL